MLRGEEQSRVRLSNCPQGVTDRGKQRDVKHILSILYLVIATLTNETLMCFGHRGAVHFLGQDILHRELPQMKTIRESSNRDQSFSGIGNSLRLRPFLDSKNPNHDK